SRLWRARDHLARLERVDELGRETGNRRHSRGETMLRSRVPERDEAKEREHADRNDEQLSLDGVPATRLGVRHCRNPLVRDAAVLSYWRGDANRKRTEGCRLFGD